MIETESVGDREPPMVDCLDQVGFGESAENRETREMIERFTDGFIDVKAPTAAFSKYQKIRCNMFRLKCPILDPPFPDG
nr:hypothetical protein Iba_chr12eCG5050 [Ipomoea batatas]